MPRLPCAQLSAIMKTWKIGSILRSYAQREPVIHETSVRVRPSDYFVDSGGALWDGRCRRLMGMARQWPPRRPKSLRRPTAEPAAEHANLEMLLDETRYEFDAQGRMCHTTRPRLPLPDRGGLCQRRLDRRGMVPLAPGATGHPCPRHHARRHHARARSQDDCRGACGPDFRG